MLPVFATPRTEKELGHLFPEDCLIPVHGRIEVDLLEVVNEVGGPRVDVVDDVLLTGQLLGERIQLLKLVQVV